MSIVGLFGFLGWLVLSVFLTRLILRWFLGPLHEVAKNSKEPTQFSIGDIYLLIGQIALASLPVALVPLDDVERAGIVGVIAIFLSLSWFMCCQILARNRIRRAKVRIIAMLLFHFQLAIAALYGFGALPIRHHIVFGFSKSRSRNIFLCRCLVDLSASIKLDIRTARGRSEIPDTTRRKRAAFWRRPFRNSAFGNPARKESAYTAGCSFLNLCFTNWTKTV